METLKRWKMPSISPMVEWRLQAVGESEVLLSVNVPADAAQKLIDRLIESKTP